MRDSHGLVRRTVIARRVELAFGIATAVAEIFALTIVARSGYARTNWAGWFLAPLLFYLLPGFFVCFGAYTHAVRGKSYGQIILSIVALLMCAVGCFQVFGGILSLYGLVGAVVLLSPLTAFVAFVASLVPGNGLRP
jgi:hypothetical protein